MKKLFTSESVSAGHPDKIADQISDAILDEILKQDPNSKVAIETFIAGNNLIIGGEVKTTAKVNYEKIGKGVIKEIGYNELFYLDVNNIQTNIIVGEQSPDINQGVELKNDEIGAGDQGLMFGFATNQTKEFMPLPIMIAHNILKELERVRKEEVDFLGPDAKSQVTIEYEGNKPIRVDSILVSTQHTENITKNEIEKTILKIIKSQIKDYNYDEDTKFYINPTGKFVIGGPIGDAGLTGRKIIVDTYGGYARHGGGAFSGKDSTKVDRSAAYIARYIAKNIVAANLAEDCEIQLSYAIGIPEPVSISINTFNTGVMNDQTLAELISNNYSLTPKWIIDTLNLREPIFKETAKFGHFGNENYPWEKLNLVDDMKKWIK